MSSSLQANDVLPDLPFVNREDELGTLERFFAGRSRDSARVGLLDGESGLGKTELIKHVQERLSGQHLVVWLTAADEDGCHRDIFERALYETLRAIGTSVKDGRAEVDRDKLVAFAKNILRSAVTDASEIDDISSDSLFDITQHRAASAIRSLGLDVFKIAACFHSLIEILRTEAIKTIFVVEDLHKRKTQDGERLIDFLISLDKISDASSCWSALITSLPIGDHFDGANGLRPFWINRNRWQIESWTIGALARPHMELLATLYVENSHSTRPILDASMGNPRTFFEIIQKLSFRKRLTIHDKKVRLPSEVRDILALGNTFAEALTAKGGMRRLCGALAVGATDVPLRVLTRMAFGRNYGMPDDFTQSFDALRASSYILTHKDASGEVWCRLRDDGNREIARRALGAALLDEIEVHRGLFEGYSSLFSEVDLTRLQDIGNPSSAISKDISSIPFIDLYVQACLHAVSCGVADWHRFALSAVRLLDHFGRFTEVITFGNTILPKIDAVFDERGTIGICLRSLLSKAYYYRRDFNACLRTMTDEHLSVCSQSEILYYQASSVISAKTDPSPQIKTGAVVQRVKHGGDVDKDWLPQIVSAHAFAQLEMGAFVKACATYSLYCVRRGLSGRRDANWHTFAMMSPLFLPIHTAEGLCDAAYRFFSDTRRMRLAGMALHNLGYCSLRRHDFEMAYDRFDRSDSILTANAEEEAGFCKINKAFIHLIRSEGREAKALSSDALKFFTSPFYIAAGRVNLALADWMLGSKSAAAHLDRIPAAAGLALDPNQAWRIVFNRAFIEMHTAGVQPVQEMVNQYFDAIRETRSTRDAALFWNHMVANLRRVHPDIVWPEFRAFGARPLSFVTTKLSPFRASTLCFGHA